MTAGGDRAARSGDGSPLERYGPCLALLGIAAILRYAFALQPAYHHPDELWQYLETARAVAGRPFVASWEARDGIRSWLLPVLLAGPLELARTLGASSAEAVLAVRLMLAALSLGVVASGMAIGARIGRAHAICAGLLLAISTDVAFFSARTLSEPIATSLLLPATALLLRPAGGRRDWQVVVAGALAGLAFCIRFQFGPMLAVLAMLALGRGRGDWARFLAGAASALALDSIANLAMGQVPMRWLIENVRINLLAGKSAEFGIDPWYYYGVKQWEMWGWATIPLLALALIGARKAPALFAMAMVNVAVHSLIPHKEYRFIYPSLVLILVVAGFGAADVLAWARRAVRPRALRLVAAATAVATIVAVPLLPGGERQWAAGAQSTPILKAAHARADLCGIAVVAMTQPAMSYTILDRDVPSRILRGREWPAALAAERARFNYAVSGQGHAAQLARAGYQITTCQAPPAASGGIVERPALCLYRRPGGCAAPRR